MEFLKIIIPTEYPTEINIPRNYPIPPVGSDFYINFHRFCPAEDWEAVRSVLEENVLTVSEINRNTIYLQEGAPVLDALSPDGEPIEPADYRDVFLDYWEKYPSTRPPGF